MDVILHLVMLNGALGFVIYIAIGSLTVSILLNIVIQWIRYFNRSYYNVAVGPHIYRIYILYTLLLLTITCSGPYIIAIGTFNVARL